jgi:hypothetical protein
VLAKNIFFGLLALVKTHNIDGIAVDASKQVTTVREFDIFATLESDIYIWYLLQISCINIHDSHTIQKPDDKMQA